MSEPEGKKDLGGLARSIDSLFSSAGAEESAAAGPEESAAPEAAWPLGGEQADVGATVFGDLGLEPLSSEGAAAHVRVGAESADEPPAMPDLDGIQLVDSVAPQSQRVLDGQEDGADAGSTAGGPPPLPIEAAVAGDGGDPAAVVDAAWDLPSQPLGGGDAGPGREDDADDAATSTPAEAPTAPRVEAAADEPDPLDLAVEAYLAGGGDAARVRALAEQHVQTRAYGPVADAVVRLVHESEGADSEGMRLAEELLTPFVRGRLVLQLGAERSPEKRGIYHAVCTKLGESMAVAIRDGMDEAPDASERRAYYDALVAMGEVSRPVVIAMAEDDNRFLARNAVKILGETGGPGAVEVVEAALANTDWRVRKEALLALARLKPDNADEIIIGRLTDETDERAREAAITAAGELKVERAVRHMVHLLEERWEPEQVLPLLHALGQIGDPGAVPAIERHAVKDRFGPARTQVRIAAYQALNHMGTPHARRLINQAANDKDPEVKAIARELLNIP